MRYLLIVTSIFFLISSCDNSYKRIISYENLEKDLAFFQNKTNDLNEIQKEFLRYLSTYDQNPEIKTFVNLLNDNSYTYSRAFTELTKLNNEITRFKVEKEELFKAIDDTCSFIQHEIEMQKHLRDSINSFVKPVINIANKSIYDFYFTVIEIDSRIYNYSPSTINYLAFDYILRKNDSVVLKIPCEVELPIANKIQRDFLFDDELHTQIYQELESYGLPFYSADYQVKKIVFANGDKLAIDERYYSNEILTDKQYTSSSTLKGECPYMKESDFLMTRLGQLHTRINAFLNETTPVLAPFIKWYFGYYI